MNFKEIQKLDSYFVVYALIAGHWKGRTCIDVGLNDRKYLSFWQPMFEKIIGYEPNPWCNIDTSESKYDDCVVHKKAISNYTGEAILYCNMDDSGYSTLEDYTKLNFANNWKKIKQIEVEVTTLDNEHYNKTSDIDFIKIDIEQHDNYALLGAEKIIKQCSPLVHVEHFDSYTRDIFKTFNYISFVPYDKRLGLWGIPKEKSHFFERWTKK